MQPIAFGNHEATLVEVEDPTETLRVMRFRPAKPIEFKPGQYFSIILPGKRPAPFSIASSPARPEELEFGVAVVGAVTQALKEMKVGEKAVLRGPFGRFTMDHDGVLPRKVCFLAAGVGVTPLICMLRYIRDGQSGIDAVMIYSCRDASQFLWSDELSRMGREHPNIKVFLTITGAAPQGWAHGTGRVDEDLLRAAVPDFAERSFYACGPSAFIDGMFGLLRGMGVHEMKLKKESW